MSGRSRTAADLICRSCQQRRSNVLECEGLITGTVRRRRECQGCGNRFTTTEVYAEDLEALRSRVQELESLMRQIQAVAARNIPAA